MEYCLRMKSLDHNSEEFHLRMEFKNKREKRGVVCKKCGCVRHYWLRSKWQWQCKTCKFRTTLKSGTVLQFSNLSFERINKVIEVFAIDDIKMSVRKVQMMTQFSRYEPVWMLLHKLRKQMVEIQTAGSFLELNLGSVVKVKTRRVKSCQDTFLGSAEVLVLKNSSVNSLTSRRLAAIHIGGQQLIPKKLNLIKSDVLWKFRGEPIIGHLKKAKEKGFVETQMLLNKLVLVHRNVSSAYLQNYLGEFMYRINYNKWKSNFMKVLISLLI